MTKWVKLERHWWGYFLEAKDRAVAVLSHREKDLRKALREFRERSTGH